MKKLCICFLVFVLCCAPIAGVTAATLDVVNVTETGGKRMVHAEGTVARETDDTVTLFFFHPGYGPEDLGTEREAEALAYFRLIPISYDGAYRQDFLINGGSGSYTLLVKYQDDIVIETVKYLTDADLQEILTQLQDSSLSDAQLVRLVSDNAVSLGVDVSNMTDGTNAGILAQRIRDAKEAIAGQGSAAVAGAVKLAREEIALLANVRQAGVWNVVYSTLSENAHLHDIDFTAYLALGHDAQKSVCTQIMSGSFGSAADLCSRWNALVRAAGTGSGTAGGNKGGGGGGSSSGSGRTFNPQMNAEATAGKEVEYEPVFSDMEGAAWAREAVEALAYQEILSGDGTGRFLPNNSVTREQFAKIVVMAFDLYDADAACAFADVADDAWYYPYVSSAVAAGLMKGFDETDFGTGTAITREDVAVVLYRLAVEKGAAFGQPYEEFTDFAEIADYAKEAVSNLAGKGYVNGKGEGAYCPKDNTTRAEAAKLIYTLMGGLR